MIRGTTPTHVFELPFSTDLLKQFLITYAQEGEIVLEKAKDDCELLEETIRVTLTQEDTLKFSHENCVEIQLKVLTINGQLLATPICFAQIGRILNSEVLV